MKNFERTIWNELQDLKPEEIEIIHRHEVDKAGTLFLAAADILRKRGYLDEAIVIMEEGLANYPNHHLARTSLARDLFLKGMMVESQRHISVVLQKSGNNQVAHRLGLKLAIVFESKEEIKKSLETTKYLFPDDDFTRTVRNFISMEDYDSLWNFMRSELRKLKINYTKSGEEELYFASQKESNSENINEPLTAWAVPKEQYNTNSNLKAISEDEALNNKEDTNFDKDLPAALSIGASLAHVKGEIERYLVLKNFKKVGAEGLFSQRAALKPSATLDSETLGEIYINQGLWEKAYFIYLDLIREQPEKKALKDKLELIKKEWKPDNKKESIENEFIDILPRQAKNGNDVLMKKLELLKNIDKKISSKFNQEARD